MASESNPVSMSAPAYSMLGRASDDLDRDSSSFDLIDEEAPLQGYDEPARGSARVAVPRPSPPSAARRGPRSTTTATAAERLAREQSEKKRRFAQLRSQGRRDSLGFVQDKHGQLLIPDTQEAQGRGMAPTPDPEDEARRREGCRNAVLCWVAFACSYAGLGLLLLELHAEPDSFFAVRPWSEDFDARPTAYALFGFGGLLVLVMAARAIWRERHRTWLPCVALASCMRQTGTGYLLYGALSVALIFTLPYIVFLSVFRVQQVRKLPSDSPRPVG